MEKGAEAELKFLEAVDPVFNEGFNSGYFNLPPR
jgi:hypothetical protein